MSLKIRNAYYIKLGRRGDWEADSLKNHQLRFGWRGQSVADINDKRWGQIAEQLRDEQPGKPQVATTDLNRLQDICESTVEDVWVTFHAGKLWWARLKDGPVQQDGDVKYREVDGAWSDRRLNGQLLVVNDLPGKLAQLQGFRGTVCRVLEQDLLQRILEGRQSDLACQLSKLTSELVLQLESAIKALHWKDFETLVDLVFRHGGWQRVSIAGQQVKGYDLMLREPITGDQVLVQVKSQAGSAELKQTIDEYSGKDFKKIFFVVHSPAADLLAAKLPADVDLMGPERLAKLAMDAGLVSWLKDKVA